MRIRSIILAAIICIPVLLNAQTRPEPGTGPEGLEFSKKVTSIEGRSKYQIDLEAFVTGTTKIVVSEDILPSDIVFVFDLSSSMTRNNVSVNIENRNRVSNGTKLKPSNDTYKIVIDGKEYYLKCFEEYSYSLDSSHSPNPETHWFIATYYEWFFTHSFTYSYYYSESPNDLDNLATARSNATLWKQVSNTVNDSDDSSSKTTPPTPSKPNNNNGGYGVTSADEIYRVSTSTQTMSRLAALKLAANSFVKTILANSPTISDEKHKVAIVGFNKRGAQLMALTDVSSSNIGSFETTINNISTDSVPNGSSSYTNPSSGLYQAAQIIDGVKNDGRAKVVIFFTDGNPCGSGSNSFDNSYGRAAVNMAYVLKQPATASFNYTYDDPVSGNPEGTNYQTGYGAKVYSVAILDQENNKIRRFLHFTSSNYPDKFLANTYTFPDNKTGEGGEDPHDYYQLSNGTDLSSIFEKIAHESSQGTASINLDAKTTTVIDVVGDNFRLPENASTDDIGLYLKACTGSETVGDDHPKTVFLFEGPEIDARTKFPGIGVSVNKTTKEVKVSGYDFAANYVSEKKKEDGTSYSPAQYTGYKLIIRFNIEIDPESAGGAYVSTNKESSGIYFKDENNQDVQIAAFEVPFVKIPNLVVVKKGLHVGESAIFNMSEIQDDGTEVLIENIILVATCKEEGEPAVCRVKIQNPGRYKVTESTWSWAYDLSSITESYTYEDSGDITQQQWEEKGYDGVRYIIPTTFGTEVNLDGRYIIRNVNDFTEDKSTYFGTVFEFVNSDDARIGTKANPAHDEANVVNRFYESHKSSK